MPALLNRKVFFDHVRASLFGGVLSPETVRGIDAIFDACPAEFPTDHLGYCLATVRREAGPDMLPINEIGRGKGKKYGKAVGKYGQIYFGRGLVQLTWDYNYEKADKKLHELGILKPEESLLKNPDLANRLDVASAIMFHGMIEGWFTGKKLSDYFGPGKRNPIGARAIINGTDKAALIAGYFSEFRDALIAAGYEIPKAEPKPTKPKAAAKPAAKKSAVTTHKARPRRR